MFSEKSDKFATFFGILKGCPGFYHDHGVSTSFYGHYFGKAENSCDRQKYQNNYRSSFTM